MCAGEKARCNRKGCAVCLQPDVTVAAPVPVQGMCRDSSNYTAQVCISDDSNILTVQSLSETKGVQDQRFWSPGCHG